MKTGESIRGYRILREFTTAGGGRCRWTFGEKDGAEYFLKEFLSPKYPIPGSPGSSKTIERKRAECEVFEKRHATLMREIKKCTAAGGNLVRTVDFFRQSTRYYKVTEKVVIAGLAPADVALLPLADRALILLTLCHSLRILHRLHIVHGDLKPDNMLISRTRGGAYAAKLIDFDDSYVAGKPPSRDEIVGDQVYYSPEVGLYVTRSDKVTARDLCEAADVFALGLIFAEYLTGEFPEYDRRTSGYAWQAVLRREKLRLSLHGEERKYLELLDKMFTLEPKKRPGAEDVFGELKGIHSECRSSMKTRREEMGSEARRDDGRTPHTGESETRLRGRLVEERRGHSDDHGVPGAKSSSDRPLPSKEGESKLRGRLIETMRERTRLSDSGTRCASDSGEGSVPRPKSLLDRKSGEK